MTPEKRAEAITLANDIEETLSYLYTTVEGIEQDADFLLRDSSTFDKVPKSYIVDAAAGHVHDFYTGLEQIYERIIIFTEGKKPTGQDFHKQILTIVHEKLKLTDEDERDFLKDLCGFRHVFRKNYRVRMDEVRIESKAREIGIRWPGIEQKINKFKKQLRQDPPDETLARQ